MPRNYDHDDASADRLGDTSGPLFSLYSKMLEGDDNNRAERQQKNAEGIVLFTGLFSAALSALITVSIQDLRPGPQDTSPFSPPRYAIWVNSLWISSLVISITSALLATLIQQWARRHVKVTQPLGAAHERARIRQHIFNDVSYSQFLTVTDVVHTLLHLSVFLFFAGLLVLLRYINHIVFNAVVVWVTLCVLVYAYITFLPFFQPANPHYSPLSSLAWQIYANILHPVYNVPHRAFEFLSQKIKRGNRDKDVRRPAAPATRLLNRVVKKAEKLVSEKSAKLDAGILETLVVTLGEDGAGRERFFEAIPGFYDSQMVVDVDSVKENLDLSPNLFTDFQRTVMLFLDQTLSSDSVSEMVKCRRILTCLNASYKVLGGCAVAVTSITHQIVRSWNWNAMMPLSPEVGLILRQWGNSIDPSISLIGSCTIARIIASVETRDDTWKMLAMSRLGVSEGVLWRYLEYGDSVLLDNLIKTTRLFFDKRIQFRGMLRSISGFNVKETLPELQHDFCTLWNEIAEKSKYSGDFVFILDDISRVYNDLHHTTPTTAAVLPTSTTANNGSLLPGSSYALCPDPRSRHLRVLPPNGSRLVVDVAVSSYAPSPGIVRPFISPQQCDETNTNPNPVLDAQSSRDPLSPLLESPIETQSPMSPALGHSYSASTSHSLTTPPDVYSSAPPVIVVTDEHDVQDMNSLNAHNPYQSDTPSRNFPWSTSPWAEKSVV